MFLVLQRYKKIFSKFSLELEDWTASSYQGCIPRASSGKCIGYFPSERQSWQGGKEKEKNLIGFLQFPWVDFLRGESFWSLSYSVLLQPESQGQSADPQAGWGVTASWRSNPWAGRGRSASQELGPWAGRGRLTSWDPRTGVGCTEGLQCDQCWVGLRGCNFNSLPVCSPQMGIDTMV